MSDERSKQEQFNRLGDRLEGARLRAERQQVDEWIDAIEGVCCWESLEGAERQRVREILKEVYEAGRSLERKGVERLEAECRLHVYEKFCLHDDLREAQHE